MFPRTSCWTEKAGRGLATTKFVGLPIIRTIVFRGLYWVPLMLGNSLLEFEGREGAGQNGLRTFR